MSSRAIMFAAKVIGRIANGVAEPLDRLANSYWYDCPLGSTQERSRVVYEGLASEARRKQHSEIDDYEQRHGFAVDSEWFHDLALHTQVVVKKSEICYQHGRLLYTAIRSYIQRNHPRYMTIVETGTARGFSALCMAKALADADIEGKILTFDVLPHNVKMYWNCVDTVEAPKTRAELLVDYSELVERYLVFHQGDTRIELPKVQVPRVNYAFLDSVHTYEYVNREFEYVSNKQETGDMAFFDDYTSAFPGVVKAVDEIACVYGYTKHVISASVGRRYAILSKQ